ncbi:MAG: hypothetical protein WC998_04590 [Candidatus Paceibacterota bacterium]|jgi:hypothetical protein
MGSALKVLGAGSLTTSNATLATASNSVKTIVKEVVLSNVNSASALNALVTFNSINIIPNKSIPLNDALVVKLSSILSSGNLIQGYASSGISVSYYISGIEVTT